MATVSVDDMANSIQRIAGSKRIPTLPEVAMRLLEIARQDEPDFAEAARAIRSDPAVCGKILKTVNSALFGLRGTIKTIEQAVPTLGISMLRTLILSFHLSSKTKNAASTRRSQAIWRSCLTQAVVAELISERTKSDSGSAFMAGLLQDIGVLAMLAEHPDEYEEYVLDLSNLPNTAAAERAHFGFSHVDVSLAILEHWNIGSEFSAAVRQHHDRLFASDVGARGNLATVLRAAHLGAAALLPSDIGVGGDAAAWREWIEFLQSQLNFDSAAVDDLISEVNDRVHEYSVMFNFDIGDRPEDGDVILEAKDLLQEIAITSQLRLVESRKSKTATNPANDPLYRDCLSGLYNRRYFEECLGNQVSDWLRRRKPVALLFLDVDRFKLINDEHGHSAGDQAIKHVASWLTTVTRKNDIVVRLGGDEFVVAMQMARPKDDSVMQRIAQQVPKMKLKNNEVLSVSLSVGCVFHQPEKGSTLDLNGLIDLADQLMYEAKNAGGEKMAIREIS